MSESVEFKDQLFRINESAKRLNVSPATLYREMAAGRLTPIRIRNRTLFTGSELLRYVEAALDRGRAHRSSQTTSEQESAQ